MCRSFATPHTPGRTTIVQPHRLSARLIILSRIVIGNRFWMNYWPRSSADEPEIASKFYLNHAQIRELHAAGMVVGSHGLNHLVFSKLTFAQQRDEITRSFADLSANYGKSGSTFCYPYGGAHTFTPDTIAVLNEAGSMFSFSVNPRDITAADIKNARQALPRYDCNMFPHGKASLGTEKACQAA